MKKSTVIMIAMTTVCWALMLGIVAHECLKGVPYTDSTITVEEGAPCHTFNAKRFNTLVIPTVNNSKMSIISDSFAGIRVNVSDTAKNVTISVPDQLKRFLLCENTGDTLRISIQTPPEDTIKDPGSYRLRRLNCPVPVTVTTPYPIVSMFLGCDYSVAINGMVSDSLNITSRFTSVMLNSCKINNVKMKSTWRNRISLYLDGSEIDSLIPHNGNYQANLRGDSLTCVNALIMDSDNKDGVTVYATNMRINSSSVPNTALKLFTENSTIQHISSK